MATTTKLAQFVNELSYADLPDEVVKRAKEIALNSWGAQLACSTLPWSKSTYRFGRNQGGTPEATVVNYGIRTSAANAAFINGCFAHGFELDDNHGRTGVKGGCITVPTALAIGEGRLSTGKEFITALVAGYEVMTRMALAAHKGWREGQHHRTGHAGAIGAASVTGKLMGMDEPTLANALAIAAGQMIGLENGHATSMNKGFLKRTFGGMANFGGIRAALLAKEGMTTTDTTLDADGGFCRAFNVEDPDAFTAGLGGDWEILKAHFKIYAQDGYIQPMTEALERLRNENTFDVADIDHIWLGTNKFAYEEILGPVRDPQDLTDAQWSANFSAAMFLLKGGAGFHEYTEQNLHDPSIRELSERIFVGVDDEIEAEFQRTRPRGAKVVITFKSGQELTTQVDHLRPMTDKDLDDKFRKLSTVVLDGARSERLLEMARNLDEVRDVSMLAPLLVR